MIHSDPIAARVASCESLHPGLRRVVLVPESGGLFPAGSAGAHIRLALRHGDHLWRNAYSVVSPPNCRDSYTIIVRRVANSRGGSAYIHDHLKPGDTVMVDLPVNLFPIATIARKHLMLAGGIGVTPFLSYLPILADNKVKFELHVCCRGDDVAVFTALLAAWPDAHVHPDDGSPALDIGAVLGGQFLGTHLSMCGPEPFMAQITATAAAIGWPAARIHQEFFTGATSGTAFRAVLAQSGITIDVPADQGLLDALEAAGIDAPYMCRGGACGQCYLPVLEGIPEHRDHFLTADQRAANTAIMPCVSRAKSATLVLDI